MNIVVKLMKHNLLFIICIVCFMIVTIFPASAEEIRYSDVTEKDWAYNIIMDLTNKGILNGYMLSDGSYIFKPYEKITRAEFVKLITIKFNVPIGFDDISKFSFDDIQGHWAEIYISAAQRNNLVYGKDEKGTLFYPDDYLTREEAFVLIARACVIFKNIPLPNEAEAVQIINNFSDHQFVSDWALAETALCVKNKIVTGILEDNFLEDTSAYLLLPTFPINRSEVCKMIDAEILSS